MRMHGANTARKAVAELIGGARAGRGGALLVRAEPGLGAGALLDHAAACFERAGEGGTVLRARGVAAETAVPYSGLHALLRPVADRAAPDDPRTAALARALALGAAPADDGPVLAGLPALLHDLAAEGPLLLCVDDAHHLDAPSRRALGFAARRLGPPLPVAMLVAARCDGAEDPLLAGLPVLTLEPLDAAAAGALLDDLLPADADPAVREALLHSGGGNPGLLTDLAASLTPAQLTGAEPLPHPLPATGPRLRAAAAELAGLPEQTRTLLLLAAAAYELGGSADCSALARAAALAGLGPHGDDPAPSRGVLRREGDRLCFANPLLRRAAYWGESPERRRTAHRLLARALEGTRTGEGRSGGGAEAGAPHRLLALRHRAAAALPQEGADPELADALAATASDTTASDEHTHAELADALWRSAELTGTGDEPGGAQDTGVRAARLTAAAEHAWSAGRPYRALALLDRARALPVHDTVRGRTELVRGVLELRNGVVTDAHELLSYAARLLGPYDPHTARRALLHATEAAWAIGDIAGLRADLARIAGLRTPAEDPLLDDYCAGLDAVLSGDIARGGPMLLRVLEHAAGERQPWRLIRAGIVALVVGDVAAAHDLNTRALAAARACGPAAVVPQALEHLAYSELRAGRHSRARAHAEAGLRRARRTGQRNCAAHHHAVLAMAAAVRGTRRPAPGTPARRARTPARTAWASPPPWPSGRWPAATWGTAGRTRRRPGWSRWWAPGRASCRGPAPGAGTSRSRRWPRRAWWRRPHRRAIRVPRAPRWRSSPSGPPSPRTRWRPSSSPAAGPCSPGRRRRRSCSRRRWRSTRGSTATSSTAAPSCCTARRCAADAGRARPAGCCATRFWPSSGATPAAGPTRPAPSCGPPARRPGRARRGCWAG
ncbi:AAA family ATPase [Streptomyces sp. KL2]|uniref:AAA family ATPase n=1 Tax=Streptomyces sp. KL2 TaxID=3050126 RepID=UPI00397B086C